MNVATASVTPSSSITPIYKRALKKYLKSSRNRSSSSDPDWSPFRAAEKQYKVRFPPPNLSQVLDLALLDPARADEFVRGGWTGSIDTIEWRALRMEDGHMAYSIDSIPGLVVIPSFLSHDEQRATVRWALRDHARYPNETNLDTHYLIPHDGVWSLARDPSSSSTLIHPRLPPEETLASPSGPRELISNTPASPATFSELANQTKLPAPPSPNARSLPAVSLVPKLRWANIGWYYHWGTKQYDFTRGKEPVDLRIAELCRKAVQSVPWNDVYTKDEQDWGEDADKWKAWHQGYEPDAGIVNFYQTKDTLMAHVDRSEVCATSPLVSISLGAAAIFLIGGQTRDTPPAALLLRSGDVVIMSGPGCRRAYHGVPRILEDTLPNHLAELPLEHPEGKDWMDYAQYMHNTRINVNVRQVFPKGFDPGLGVGT